MWADYDESDNEDVHYLLAKYKKLKEKIEILELLQEVKELKREISKSYAYETDDEEEVPAPSINYRYFSKKNRQPYKPPKRVNRWWYDDDSDQDQHYESSDSEDNQERTFQSSFGFFESHAEHNESKRMTMGDYCELDEESEVEGPITEQQEEQQSWDDNMHMDEVTLSNDESCEHIVHEPTPAVSEPTVEDYVSSDDQDFQIFSQEIIDSAWESLKKMLREPETKEVGEVATCPTTLIIPSKQPSVDFLGTESKNSNMPKQPVVLMNQPILTTIFAKISCYEGVINVTCGSLNLRLLLSRPTNNPPIMDDLIVINTIDDHVKEHTANMLSDTAHDRKTIVSCSRKKEKTAPGLTKGTFKRKWLDEDPKKDIPPYTQHEVKRSRIDGRHTSDPP